MNCKTTTLALLHKEKQNRKSIAFVTGHFNILHPGHIRFLRFAAEQADILVVGLLDKKCSPNAYFSNEDRYQALEALDIVDHVIVVNGDRLHVINELKPDTVVKGKEFEDKHNPEQEIVELYGGRLIFSSGEKLFSSSELLKAQFAESSPLKNKIAGFVQRYQLNAAQLLSKLEAIRTLNVCVIGDIIIDEYQECLPIGMSQEDPTIAVSPLESFKFLGGAGIVAAHAASLGATVNLFSVLGNDQNASIALNKLQEFGVTAQVQTDHSRPSTHKLRYRAKDKTLLRVNSYRKHDLDNKHIKGLVERFSEIADNTDLVIFADFSFGVACQKLIQSIQTVCQQKNIPMVADSQTSSQVGDLTKFKDLLLTTPTEIEARQAVKDENSGLVEISRILSEQLDAQNLVITLGAEGALIRHLNNESGVLETDNLPAFSDTAIDTAGAGDALFITSSLLLLSGASIWEAVFCGSAASAIQVNTKGNIPIALDKLKHNLQSLLA